METSIMSIVEIASKAINSNHQILFFTLFYRQRIAGGMFNHDPNSTYSIAVQHEDKNRTNFRSVILLNTFSNNE